MHRYRSTIVARHGKVSAELRFLRGPSNRRSRRKLGLSYSEVREVLGTVRTLCVTHTLTVEHHRKGTEIAERYGFSFCDSVIAETALLAGCKTLYSEDLQHRQVIDKQLTVLNPFSKSR